MKRLYDKALVDEIAKKYGNEAAFLSDFSRALLDIIREGLIRDGLVRLHQFGTFKLKWMSSREGVHPSTGEKMTIKGRPRVIFTPAKYLKEIIEPNPPELLPIDAVDQLEDSKTESRDESETLVIQLKSEEPESSVVEPEAEKVEKRESVEIAEAVEDIHENVIEQADEYDKEYFADDDKDSAVADISDEIEVLEQVVEILKKDPVEEDNLEDSHKDQVASDWLDEPVVQEIKKISELQYFKSDVGVSNDVAVAEAPANDFNPEQTFDEAVAKQVEAKKSGIDANSQAVDSLDFDLTENDDAKNKTEGSSGRSWFAVAAAVIVLLATGLLVNSLWQPESEPGEVKYLYSYYPDDKTKTDVTAREVPAVEEEKSVAVEEIDEQSETVVAENQTAAPVETDSVISEVVTEPETKVSGSEVAKAEETVEETVAESVEDQPAVDDEQIVVSAEQYNEVKRASAEESVFFLERDYRLVNGDSLWRLAKKHYVNPFYWPHIYQANHKKIENPDRVKIGKTVLLPTLYGEPDHLTRRDRRNIAMGYYFNYLYHKRKGNPFAYFSLIGVDKYDPELLIEFRKEISRSDVNNLALLSE